MFPLQRFPLACCSVLIATCLLLTSFLSVDLLFRRGSFSRDFDFDLIAQEAKNRSSKAAASVASRSRVAKFFKSMYVLLLCLNFSPLPLKLLLRDSHSFSSLSGAGNSGSKKAAHIATDEDSACTSAAGFLSGLTVQVHTYSFCNFSRCFCVQLTTLLNSATALLNSSTGQLLRNQLA